MSQKRHRRRRADSRSEKDSLPVYDGDRVTVELRDGNVGMLAVEPGAPEDEAFLSELCDAFQEVTEAAPGAVVLTGFGGTVVPREWSGSDCTGVNSSLETGSQHPYSVVSSLDCPVIAALRGAVLDGGLALSLCADVRISSRSAEYGLPGITAESIREEDERTRLVATVGRARTCELLSTTKTYDAGTALDWGLINEVAETDAVVDRALTMAEAFTHRSTITYRYVKRAVNAASLSSESEVGPDQADAVRVRPTGESGTTAGDTDGSPPYGALELDEPRDGIHRITLNRQRRLNALTGPMLDELRHAFGRVSARDPKAVVVEGSGHRAFSVGLDPRAEVSQAGTAADGVAIARKAQRATAELASIDAPTVAGVSGYALGGGLEVALAADARVGGESSTYGLPEITHDLVPSAGGTQRLPGIVGRGRAMEMLFTGDHYDAETGADWGLLTEVVSDGQVTSAMLDLAERFAASDVPRQNRVAETTPTIEGYVMERAGNRHGFARGPFDDTNVAGRP